MQSSVVLLVKTLFVEPHLVARCQMCDRRPALESSSYTFLMMTTRGCDARLPGCYERVVAELRRVCCCWLVIRRVGYSESAGELVEYN
jgi:hypothetical protein